MPPVPGSSGSSLRPGEKKCSTGFLGGILAILLFFAQLFDLWGLKLAGWFDRIFLDQLPPFLASFFFPDFYTNAPWAKIGFPSSITEFIIPVCYYWLLGVFLWGLLSNLVALLTGKLRRINRIWVVLALTLLAFNSFILYYNQHWGAGDGKIDQQECAEMTTPAERSECLLRLVDAGGDISLCAEVAAADQSTCYRLGALSKHDPALCNFISEPDLSAQCIDQVSGSEAGDTEVQ